MFSKCATLNYKYKVVDITTLEVEVYKKDNFMAFVLSCTVLVCCYCVFTQDVDFPPVC